MTVLKNRDPQLLTDAMDLVSDLLSHYGWYILAAIVGSLFIWNKYFRKIVHQLRQQNEDAEVLSTRAEQIERARRRQQEIYDKQMEEFLRKQTENQKQKKNQLSELETIIEKNKDTNDLRKRNSKPLRDNSFNPLMGQSSGSTYRPSRACGPSGGG